jgi:hypothetical protein
LQSMYVLIKVNLGILRPKYFNCCIPFALCFIHVPAEMWTISYRLYWQRNCIPHRGRKFSFLTMPANTFSTWCKKRICHAA